MTEHDVSLAALVASLAATDPDQERKLEIARARFADLSTAEKRGTEEERRYPGLGGKSIIDRIADHFHIHPGIAFSPSEVMAFLRIPNGNIEGVRVSLKRLVARGVLEHVGHAQYRLGTDGSGGSR